ncbi:MAG: hypothetical protein C9356_17160 [Oleiphilus sp.]|nr:MAG: hypothetical protein C9356_17160 [Oleiphilus sp.]
MVEDSVKVLVVEDDPDDIYLIREYLGQDANKKFNIETCQNLQSALDAISQKSFDVVLLDLGLPDAEGMEALDTLVQLDTHTPIIVLTVHDDEFGEAAIRKGAADYLPKRLCNTDLLSRAVRYAIERHSLLAELQERAENDVLTGLPNRAMMYDKLDFMIAQCERSKAPFSLVMMDFDDFKQINDTHGHRYGDQLIKAFSKRLKSLIRKSDYAARYGGDEFLMIVANYTNEEELLNLIKRKQEQLSKPYKLLIDGKTFTQNIEISIGVMQWQPGMTTPMMLEKADQAMYRSKRNHEAALTFF